MEREYPLATSAKLKQVKFFNRHNHLPSEQQWLALEDILTTIEDAANNKLEDGKIYLSSIDCGIGKTTSLIFMIRELLVSDEHADVSVMVMLSTKSQIKTFVDEVGIDKKDIAVYTSDDELNSLGNTLPTNARCLITTQQMIDSRCGNDLVSNHNEFLYNGKLRQVRVWDEALDIGSSVSVNSKMLFGAVTAFMKVKKSLSDYMEDLLKQLKELEHGELLYIPNLEKKFNITKNDLVPALKDQSDEIKDAVLDLWSIQGKYAKVFKDSYSSTIINYALRIPQDLYPLIVLDAGARVAGTYPLQEREKDNIIRLATATKTYKNLMVYGYDISSGKTKLKNRNSIAKIIAQVINNDPFHHSLFLQHKGAGYKERVEKHLNMTISRDDLFECEYGLHKATNEFADCDRTFMTSALVYRDSEYTAKGHLWSETDIAKELNKEYFALIKSGEIKENIMQGTSRSNIRRCMRDDCPPSELHVFGSKNTGIFKYIQEIYPGCKLKMVKTVKTPKTPPAVATTLEYITKCLEYEDRPIAFKEITDTTNMRSDSFKRSVRDNPIFKNELAMLGLVEGNLNNLKARATHFVKHANLFGFSKVA